VHFCELPSSGTYTRMSKLAAAGDVSVSRSFSFAPSTPLSSSLTRIFSHCEVVPVVRLVCEPVSPLTPVMVVAPRHALGLTHAVGVPASPPVPLSPVPLSRTVASVPASTGGGAESTCTTGGSATSRGGVAESRTVVLASSSSGSIRPPSSRSATPLAHATAAAQPKANTTATMRRPMDAP